MPQVMSMFVPSEDGGGAALPAPGAAWLIRRCGPHSAHGLLWRDATVRHHLPQVLLVLHCTRRWIHALSALLTAWQGTS
jgi:hypothetical protein